jgi:hypothetical protein
MVNAISMPPTSSPPPPLEMNSKNTLTQAHRQSDVAVIDQLVQDAMAYNTVGQLRALFEFSRRLPYYSPFNCLLLHVQNPNARFVAPVEKWQKLKRTLKPGARPLVILAPMRPVLFVFDVSDTEGEELPLNVAAAMTSAFHVEGVVEATTRLRFHKQCTKADIHIESTLLHPDLAGDIRRSGAGFQVRLNACQNLTQQFATLVHELAHLFCGHLGHFPSEWWPDRNHLDLKTMELEAEAVAWLVCQRFQVMPASAQYLSGYLNESTDLPKFSLDAILVAAGAIEAMAHGRLPARLRSQKTKPRLIS